MGSYALAFCKHMEYLIVQAAFLQRCGTHQTAFLHHILQSNSALLLCKATLHHIVQSNSALLLFAQFGCISTLNANYWPWAPGQGRSSSSSSLSIYENILNIMLSISNMFDSHLDCGACLDDRRLLSPSLPRRLSHSTPATQFGIF